MRGDRLSGRTAAHGHARTLSSLRTHAAVLFIDHHRLVGLSRQGEVGPSNCGCGREATSQKAHLIWSKVVGVQSGHAPAQCIEELVLCHFGPTCGSRLILINVCGPVEVCSLSTDF